MIHIIIQFFKFWFVLVAFVRGDGRGRHIVKWESPIYFQSLTKLFLNPFSHLKKCLVFLRDVDKSEDGERERDCLSVTRRTEFKIFKIIWNIVTYVSENINRNKKQKLLIRFFEMYLLVNRSRPRIFMVLNIFQNIHLF